MKNKMIFLFSLIAILTMTACSAAGTSSQSATQTQTAASSTELPMLSKLVVGTFKLIESTSAPITQDQAQQLVILWKAYKELQGRDTKAQQEVTDLLSQINSTYTTQQISAIDAMNLSARDVMTLAQQLGVNSAQGSTTSNNSSSRSSSSSSSSRSSGGPSGFPGGGLPPDLGGGGFGAGSSSSGTSATPSASMRATLQARRSSSTAFTSNIAALMVEPLILKLEAIANPG